MARLVPAFEQFFDSAGNPLVKGKLYFYESGSSTLERETFSNSDNTISNANPVILNGDGRAPNIFGGGSYRVVLTDRDDVQILSRDPVGGDTGTTFGADWNSTTTYGLYDVIREDGQYWISESTGNIGNNPSSDSGANWSPWPVLPEQVLITGENPYLEVLSTGDNWAQIRLRNTVGGARLFAASAGHFLLRATDSEGVDGFTYMYCYKDTGQVRLDHGGSQRLLTTSTGISVSGDIDVTDDIRMSGTNPLLDIESAGGGASLLQLRNTEGGVKVFADSGNLNIRQTNAGAVTEDYWVKCERDAGVFLYYNGIPRAETADTGLLANGKIQGDGGGSTATDFAGVFVNKNNSSTYNALISFLSSTQTAQGGIQAANGKIPQFVSPSDVRLKDNILPKDSTECIERFKQINFVTYNQYDNILREGDSFENEGVIADEYELLYPDAVTTQEGDPFKVKQVGFMHGHDESVAVQYLLSKVEELTARLEALGG